MSKRDSTPPINLEEILHTLKICLPDLREIYGVKSLGVFGSYARGEGKPRSDIDLLVEFDRPPTMFEFVRLKRYLTAALGVKVDLVMRTALKPEIGRHILSEVVLV
jgi:predicted nucleotidyltransferase